MSWNSIYTRSFLLKKYKIDIINIIIGYINDNSFKSLIDFFSFPVYMVATIGYFLILFRTSFSNEFFLHTFWHHLQGNYTKNYIFWNSGTNRITKYPPVAALCLGSGCRAYKKTTKKNILTAVTTQEFKISCKSKYRLGWKFKFYLYY